MEEILIVLQEEIKKLKIENYNLRQFKLLAIHTMTDKQLDNIINKLEGKTKPDKDLSSHLTNVNKAYADTREKK